MTHRKFRTLTGWTVALLALFAAGADAQTISITEDFNTTTTTNPWYSFNGACLTASSTAGSGTSTSAGSPPGCTAIKSSYYNENLVGGVAGVAGTAQTLPDTNYNGALRFTNGCYGTLLGICTGGGHQQNGAIISGTAYSSTAGIQITFKTTTYRGDSGGGDGADGMSFFLIDGSVTPNIGSFGGSLGYTCNNGSNPDYHGMIGGYIGLGIDEYGNFLNPGDNTSTPSGGSQIGNRIGMRGAGNVNWAWMLSHYGTSGTNYYNKGVYTTSANAVTNQQNAVKFTCQDGYLNDYNGASITGSTSNKISVYDYAAIPNASKIISGVTIANEYATGGYARSNATPILYRLKITADGLLSLSYSLNGGSWLGVLTNQSITASNGPLPATIRFGFAGSTGGASNIHEVLCFKAASLDTSGSSAASNLQQSAKVTSSTQAYFAYYDPNDWTGKLTANSLTSDASGNLSIATTANWDASCVLTGVLVNNTCTATGVAGPTAAQGTSSRVILTYNGTTGIPFQWSNLTTAQQTALTLGDSSSTDLRLRYLRGERSQEITTSGTGLYRARDFLLGDIVNSSPTAIGQPVSPYAATWRDRLVSTDTMSENSGTQSYSQFFTAQQTRQNVVYVGANDGLVHGFAAGAFTSTNTYDSSTNNGTEVLAYMPAAVVNTIHSTTPELDLSNPQYGHNFFVDAPPGSGDLFYGGVWHTWLTGGLGAGGAAIYALDITSPGTFQESRAANIVVGEWSPTNISCSNALLCGANLGNTYGSPMIRRMHNGMWAVIFGNGFNSASGDAGIYIMTIDPSTAAKTFYYLSTGKTGSGDGIANVSPVDLDGDHVVDYIYAGDVLGNVWRFDVTSGSPSSWGVSGSAPLFSTSSGQPITGSLLVAVINNTAVGGSQIMVSFGTGQQTLLTNSTPTTFATATQALYAVWDWNFASWNAKSTLKFASLDSTAGSFSTTTGLASPYTATAANLTTQTLSKNTTTGTIDVTTLPICWAGTTACTSNNKSFGWTASFPGTQEQTIYTPQLVGNALVINSIVPANNNLLACTTALPTGFTYALNLATGSTSTTTSAASSTSTSNTTQNFFPTAGDTGAVGVQTNATGSAFVVTTSASGTTTTTTSGSTSAGSSVTTPANANPFSNAAGCSVGNTYLVYQTTTGTGSATRIAPSCPLSGYRTSWSQRR
jgi:type IV pilus assembly protein PilY1